MNALWNKLPDSKSPRRQTAGATFAPNRRQLTFAPNRRQLAYCYRDSVCVAAASLESFRSPPSLVDWAEPVPLRSTSKPTPRV